MITNDIKLFVHVNLHTEVTSFYAFTCYKTFYVRNLRMFVMFVSKAGAYLSEAPFICYTLGWAALPTRLEKLVRDKNSKSPPQSLENEKCLTQVGYGLTHKH